MVERICGGAGRMGKRFAVSVGTVLDVPCATFCSGFDRLLALTGDWLDKGMR